MAIVTESKAYNKSLWSSLEPDILPLYNPSVQFRPARLYPCRYECYMLPIMTAATRSIPTPVGGPISPASAVYIHTAVASHCRPAGYVYTQIIQKSAPLYLDLPSRAPVWLRHPSPNYMGWYSGHLRHTIYARWMAPMSLNVPKSALSRQGVISQPPPPLCCLVTRPHDRQPLSLSSTPLLRHSASVTLSRIHVPALSSRTLRSADLHTVW